MSLALGEIAPPPEKQCQHRILEAHATPRGVWAFQRPLAIVIRHGVVAREERYLERKFGDAYLAYKARVPRRL